MARASSVTIAPHGITVSIGATITADIIAPNVEVRDTVGEVSQAPEGAPDPFATYQRDGAAALDHAPRDGRFKPSP